MLWNNVNICINGRVLVWPHWINKNIMYIYDLFEENGKRKSYLDLGVSWLEIEQIFQALPVVWKLMLKDDDNDEIPLSESIISELCKVKECNKVIYNRIKYDYYSVIRYYN